MDPFLLYIFSKFELIFHDFFFLSNHNFKTIQFLKSSFFQIDIKYKLKLTFKIENVIPRIVIKNKQTNKWFLKLRTTRIGYFITDYSNLNLLH